MARSKSSHLWLREHHSDEFVKLARVQNYRSRAVFKLKEIDQRDRVFRAGACVLDLGAAPGGWSEYALQRVGERGKIIALDVLEIVPIRGVEFIRGDFREDSVLEKLIEMLAERKVDVLLSDMAPDQSGKVEIDQPKSIHLAELALEMAHRALAPGGIFLVKVFQGAGFDQFYRDVKQGFSKVVIRKPKASRARSREVFLLGKGFKPGQGYPISTN
ncbi:MAG: 23S rRNA (uridine(2552)-2'-O)-methyltransferase RlmE [Methylococcaceae bacterium]|nr:23S rRNA (uridine(2552)-2'-O)-methyltransferase RlmE [Methylococcaceae bacterium]MCI0666673.1 23S rRNA (uridine(2552)-2'-O)-methyltransferase RlmE [Methylococcaceae bacterium]MCI0733329.1 23S rRNA (uridine(2552)-2'-O)-methyltransferase RlmE [Methylococcaceae bacterium]